MKYTPCPKRDPVKNYFQLPSEIFPLGLSSGALAVYSYLLCCENRNTYQCWPSYKTIGRTVRMSANTATTARTWRDILCAAVRPR